MQIKEIITLRYKAKSYAKFDGEPQKDILTNVWSIWVYQKLSFGT